MGSVQVSGKMVGTIQQDVKRKENLTSSNSARGLWPIVTIVLSVLMIMLSMQVLLQIGVLLYPAYMSIKAIQNSTSEIQHRWLTYWIIYSSIHLIEPFIPLLLWLIPFYSLIKHLFLLWCLLPNTN